jgi:hypothetical protein
MSIEIQGVECLTSFCDCGYRDGRYGMGSTVSAVDVSVMTRSLELFTDSENAVDDDGVDAFVLLDLFEVQYTTNKKHKVCCLP